MKRYLLYIVMVLSVVHSYAQRQKFQINGAARAYLFANELDIAQDIDTTTVRKTNYGHTLLDLGVSAYPGKNTEVIGMFRLRNELGGFWGGGVNFNVRQLTLKGVAGEVVRYELGDIDVGMTPYTLFNSTEEGVINEADAFALRRDIVHYDMFYIDNNWRMQGAKAEFGLEFSKFIESMDVKAFLTRQRATDGLSAPERLYGGGTITFNQSEKLQIGINNINLFDLTQTTPNDVQFTNSINTVSWKYMHPVNSGFSAGIKGEGGISYVEYRNYNDASAPEKFDDTFLDVALRAELTNLNTSVELGFKDVGPEFFSAGAQTKRVDYSRFPGLYSQITNDVVGRPVSYFDVISFNADYSFKISETLMNYRPTYGNVNPYGVATPNRRGLYLRAERKDTVTFTNSFVEVAALQEIIGSGTPKKKQFLSVKAGTDVMVNDLIGWEKDIKVDAGIGLENTKRNGEFFEAVSLNSMLIDAGLTVEFLEDFDLLLGAKLWNMSGNEFYPIRNQYNAITDFVSEEYNMTENLYAAGLRYRFSDETALSAQYQMFNLENRMENGIDYSISQFNILYNMFF